MPFRSTEPERRLYPLFLDLTGREVLVVGGGVVAARKVTRLLGCGADVTVVAPEIVQSLRSRRSSALHLIERRFDEADVESQALVFAATDDRQVNERVMAACRSRGIAVNVADSPAGSDFFVPSSADLGGVEVAISTAAGSPAVARALREVLEDELAGPVGDLLRIMTLLRKAARNAIADGEGRKVFADALLERGLFTLLREGRQSAAIELVRELCGEYSVEVPPQLEQ